MLVACRGPARRARGPAGGRAARAAGSSASPTRRWPPSSSAAPPTPASSPCATRRSPLRGHGAELAALRGAFRRGRRSLYAGQDRFAAYELLGADTSVPVVEFPDEDVTESPTKPFDTGDAYSPIDFDSFSYLHAQPLPVRDHDRGGLEQRRRRPTSRRSPAPTPSSSGSGGRVARGSARRCSRDTEAAAPIDCAAPETQIFVNHPGRAARVPRSGARARKARLGRRPVLGPGEQTRQTLDLPAGRWLLSIQYFTPLDLDLTGARLRRSSCRRHTTVSARTRSASATTASTGRPACSRATGGPVEFTISIAEPTDDPGADRLRRQGLHRQAGRRARRAARGRPLRETCGRWLDWYMGSCGREGRRPAGLSPLDCADPRRPCLESSSCEAQWRCRLAMGADIPNQGGNMDGTGDGSQPTVVLVHGAGQTPLASTASSARRATRATARSILRTRCEGCKATRSTSLTC